MALRDFKELVSQKWEEGKFLCVGLDTEFEKLPAHLQQLGPLEGMSAFNVAIIEATKDLVCAYKPNAAFYEAYGTDGYSALAATMSVARTMAPEVPVIYDAKRADIGNTNNGYVRAIFDEMGMDAITVHPYLGAEALQPFLSRKEKGVIVLCRTSNPGAGEFQDLLLEGEALYKYVARRVAYQWNKNGNCSLVVGATYPQEMSEIRELASELPFLIPGVGAQGGDLEAAVRSGKDAHGKGIIVSASRSVLYASKGEDFAYAAETSARVLHTAILKALSEKVV